MKSLPAIFIRQFLAWMLFFQVTRLIFLLWNREEITNGSAGEIFGAFYHGIYLDLAMSCYMMILPWLLFSLAFFTQKQIFLHISRWITFLLIILVSVLTISELPIYDEWQTKLTYKAIWFLGNPFEVFNTATGKQLFYGILGIAFLSTAGILVSKKLTPVDVKPQRRPWIQSVIFFILTPGLIFLGMRGGYQQIPIQVSDAYFSKQNVLNVTAVNSTFNLFSNWIENANAGEPYHFLPEQVADEEFKRLHAVEKDTTIHILTSEKPNVVLVVLEGWSADLVKSCGGYDSITPHFEELIHDGILFTNCYASGSLSDQGMAAVFSAYPAQPKTSVIRQPDKYIHIPCVNTSFKRAGYTTSFMFGGQLSYGNIRSYMYYNAFDKIIEGKDFDPAIPQGNLGVADQYLFDRVLKESEQQKEPFFSSLFTGSTHSPFDFPMEEVLHWGGKEKGYINSAYYSDRCIHDFIEGAKKKSWYKNTLFIFVSDHGHNSPKNWAFNQPEYRKIPMLFYGEVIRPEFRGMKYTEVSSQTDLASTLLHQLNMNAEQFTYSKNLFNPYSKRFAYYAVDEGFGWVKPGGNVTWYVKDNRTEFVKAGSPQQEAQLKKEGQAFLQVLMGEYFRF
ncbi:MAG: sulfatase-like hydrolase/transferase [Bacteroidota bacterium]|nr:sulfatase-like hydrolase/transferase [Bacteroidota bacterium]